MTGNIMVTECELIVNVFGYFEEVGQQCKKLHNRTWYYK